jgi:hypothetical protein
MALAAVMALYRAVSSLPVGRALFAGFTFAAATLLHIYDGVTLICIAAGVVFVMWIRKLPVRHALITASICTASAGAALLWQVWLYRRSGLPIPIWRADNILFSELALAYAFAWVLIAWGLARYWRTAGLRECFLLGWVLGCTALTLSGPFYPYPDRGTLTLQVPLMIIAGAIYFSWRPKVSWLHAILAVLIFGAGPLWKVPRRVNLVSLEEHQRDGLWYHTWTTADHQELLRTLLENATEDDVLIVDKVKRPWRTDDLWLTSGFPGRLYAGHYAVTPDYERKRDEVNAFFAESDPEEGPRFLEREGIRFVYVREDQDVARFEQVPGLRPLRRTAIGTLFEFAPRGPAFRRRGLARVPRTHRLAEVNHPGSVAGFNASRPAFMPHARFIVLLALAILACSPARATSQESGACRPLDLATALRPEIAPDESQCWTVELERGELARVRVRQMGTDVVVRLFDPSGEFRWGYDRSWDRVGGENALWIADRGGSWTLRVDIYPGRPQGRYEIEWATRGTPDGRDSLRVEVAPTSWEGRSETGVFAPPPSQSGRSLSVPRNDLERVREAQWEYLRQHGTFAAYVEDLAGFEPSQDVQVFVMGREAGWSATAGYADDPKHVCAIREGDGLGSRAVAGGVMGETWESPPRLSGVVVCDELTEPERWWPIRDQLVAELSRVWVEQYVRGLRRGGFATSVDSMAFRPASGISVRITRADASGWSAVATHAELEDRSCTIHGGREPPADGDRATARFAGPIRCEDPLATVWRHGEIQPGGTRQLPHPQPVTSLAFSADGLVITGSEDHTVRVWEVDTAELLHRLAGHEGPVRAIAVSSGAEIASGSDDGTARVWDLLLGRELVSVDHGSAVEAVALSPDGRLLLTGGVDGAGRVWETASGSLVRTLSNLAPSEEAAPSETLRVLAAALSPDGRLAALAGGVSDVLASGFVDIRDLETGVSLWAARGYRNYPDEIRGLAFAPGGQGLLVTHDECLQWIDLHGFLETRRLCRDGRLGSMPLALSADGRFVASGSSYGASLEIWEVESGELRLEEYFPPRFRSLALSPAGDAVLLGRDDGATLMRLRLNLGPRWARWP